MTKEDTQQISELKEMITTHCEDQVITDASVSDRLELLMPLVALIDPLKEIVSREQEQKTVSKWMVKLGKFIGFLAMVVSSIGVIFGAAWLVIKVIVEIKK